MNQACDLARRTRNESSSSVQYELTLNYSHRRGNTVDSEFSRQYHLAQLLMMILAIYHSELFLHYRMHVIWS
ncbi:hypothetical protein A0H81_04433 [Grifola frondosa]|uniref:Uncharacterized protein n=1 Tax=Grifola frondosa TaxID=5627 RepID=A0A1C7MFL2_GRIFR|nr:hypothetical protein A0H81_04433 [Grifola frondosa]